MKNRNRPRGFAILAVVILLALMTAAVALTLDEAVESIQSAGAVRASEMIKSAMDHGVNVAMRQIQDEDPVSLADPTVGWDIFGTNVPVDTAEFIRPSPRYPPPGRPYASQYRVRIGIRPGQRTRAPAGEDVRNSYGQVVEIQIGVEADNPGVPPAEDRVSIGVVIPRKSAHSK